MSDQNRAFLDAGHRIGLIGQKKIDEILKLCQETQKSAEAVCLEKQILTGGQVDRIKGAVGQPGMEKKPPTRAQAAPAPVPEKSSAAIWVGVGLVIVVGGAIGFFVMRKDAPPPAPPPIAVQPISKPVDVKPPPPPSPPDPALLKEKEAKDLYESGEASMKDQKWAEALDIFKNLRDKFGNTDFVRGHSAEIDQYRSTCDRNIKTAAATLDQAALQARQREMTAWVGEIEQLSEKGDRAGALVKAYQRLGSLSPDDDRKPVLQALVAKIEAEENAYRDWDAIQVHVQKKDWAEAYARLQAFAQKHSGTAMYHARTELNALVQKAHQESEAFRALSDVRKAYAAQDHLDVLQKAAHYEGTFGTTDQVAQSKDEVASMVQFARSKIGGPLEEKAKETLQKFRDALANKDHRAILSLTEELLGVLSQTERMKGKHAEVQAARNDSMKALEGELQREAAAMLSTIRKLVSSKQYSEASKLIAEIQLKYPQTSTVQQNIKELQQLAATCKTESDKELAFIIDACEQENGRWFSGGKVPCAAGLIDTASKEGSKCVRIEFRASSMTGKRNDWAWACCRLSRAVPSDAAKLSMWIRTDDANGAPVTFDLVQIEGLNEYAFSTTRTVGPNWTLLEIPLAEFRMNWVVTQKEAVKNPKLTLNKIQTVGIVSGNSSKPSAVYLDMMRFKR